MSAVTTKGKVPMEIKKVSISAKRQITIPLKFYNMLEFDTEAECIMRGNELVIRPVKANRGGEFAEYILADLIKQGYSGNDLLQRFKKAQKQIRPAIEEMLVEAEQIASLDTGYISYHDIFDTEKAK